MKNDYKVIVSRNRIIISCEDYNYRSASFDERNDIVLGGCSFLKDYIQYGIDNPSEVYYSFYIELNNDKDLVITLY